mmetsp:Transcript_22156/g.71289  ORF Transcript_22156/g.71289 Transcript_22156/m.71289 type:complete len:407 (-) Transcript_22156:399-1619(-)
MRGGDEPGLGQAGGPQHQVSHHGQHVHHHHDQAHAHGQRQDGDVQHEEEGHREHEQVRVPEEAVCSATHNGQRPHRHHDGQHQTTRGGKHGDVEFGLQQQRQTGLTIHCVRDGHREAVEEGRRHRSSAHPLVHFKRALHRHSDQARPHGELADRQDGEGEERDRQHAHRARPRHLGAVRVRDVPILSVPVDAGDDHDRQHQHQRANLGGGERGERKHGPPPQAHAGRCTSARHVRAQAAERTPECLVQAHPGLASVAGEKEDDEADECNRDGDGNVQDGFRGRGARHDGWRHVVRHRGAGGSGEAGRGGRHSDGLGHRRAGAGQVGRRQRRGDAVSRGEASGAENKFGRVRVHLDGGGLAAVDRVGELEGADAGRGGPGQLRHRHRRASHLRGHARHAQRGRRCAI